MATEKRLIDANALDSKLEALVQKYAAQGRNEVAKDYSFVQTVLLTAPTVDAAEVVRCKDCKHYLWDDFDGCYVCMKLGKYTTRDFWCAHGERKDSEN